MVKYEEAQMQTSRAAHQQALKEYTTACKSQSLLEISSALEKERATRNCRDAKLLEIRAARNGSEQHAYFHRARFGDVS
jgi:hypothetical protein